MLLPIFPFDRPPVVVSTTWLVPFLLDPAAALARHPPLRMKLQCLSLVATFLHSLSWRAPGFLRPRPCWRAFAFLLGRQSTRGCSVCGPDLMLPQRAFLRLVLFCTCPPLCAGALWTMPAWVWRDIFLGLTAPVRLSTANIPEPVLKQ